MLHGECDFKTIYNYYRYDSLKDFRKLIVMRIVVKVIISALFISYEVNNSPEGGYWIEKFYIN